MIRIQVKTRSTLSSACNVCSLEEVALEALSYVLRYVQNS